MIEAYLIIAVSYSIPLLLATLGTINNEKVGHLNLGVEGIMLMGAFGAFAFGYSTDSAILALVGGMLFSMILAGIYAVFTITFKTSQTVTGLTITILGVGLSSALGINYVGVNFGEGVASLAVNRPIPLLSEIPLIGNVLFNQNILVYLSLILAVVMYILYNKTRIGLNIKSIGEDPNAAEAAGVNVTKYKYINILLGGALIGLGGAYLTIILTNAWFNNVTAGRGWVAIALVVFSSWKPLRAIIGAFIFGGLQIVGVYFELPFSAYLIASLPYAVTIIVLISISYFSKSSTKVPAALGKSYFREDR